jgi:hypothetical protein
MKRLFCVVNRQGLVIPKVDAGYFESKIEAKHHRDAQPKDKDGYPTAFVSFGPDHDRSVSPVKHGWNKGRHPKQGKNQSANGGKPKIKR